MTNLEEASIVVEHDGVTVHKSFEDEDFPVPAIAFEVHADRQEAVDVTITDVVPPEVPSENIGFHPEFGAEFWSIEGDDIVFERRFDAGEEYTTVYGIRPEQVDDVESHLEEPDLATSPAGSLAGSDEIGGVDGDITVEPLDLDADVDADEPDQHEEPDPSPGEGVDGEGPPRTDSPEEGVVAALAAEIRSGEVDDAELRALREALLDVDPEGAGDSQDARVAHLQAAVSDLRAYTDAMERFLDENGGGRAAITDLREQVTAVESEVEALEDRTEDTADLAHRLGSDVEELTGDLETIDDRLADLEAGMDGARDEVADVEAEVETVYEELDDLHVDVEELTADLETVREESGGADDVDDRLTALEDDVDAIRRDLEDLAEMRDRMASVFGALDADGE